MWGLLNEKVVEMREWRALHCASHLEVKLVLWRARPRGRAVTYAYARRLLTGGNAGVFHPVSNAGVFHPVSNAGVFHPVSNAGGRFRRSDAAQVCNHVVSIGPSECSSTLAARQIVSERW